MCGMAARPQRVLLGYDGSNGAERALAAAASLVGYGSTLAVVTVASRAADSAEPSLSDARRRLLDLHVAATYVERRGDAADELVDAAQVLEADVLVVGARTQNGHLELVLGPVSADVVQRAPATCSSSDRRRRLHDPVIERVTHEIGAAR
jgi:nucleotide-binding universal stress UspA family protein